MNPATATETPREPAGDESVLQSFRISPFQSDLLDLSRWVAALLVVIAHTRSLIFASPSEIKGRLGIAWKPFYLMTGLGHSAVMVFFVMSGFLVGGRVLDRLAQGNFSWRKYLVDRSSRLYAVYLVALLLGAGFDAFGSHHLNRFGLYNHSYKGNVEAVAHNFDQALTPKVFLANLCICQTVLDPVYGSNEPLWSLANEAWYYLAGPLLFILLCRKAGRAWPVHAGLLAGLCWFLPASLRIFFFVWLMGAALYFVNARVRFPFWLALLLFLGSLASSRFRLVKLPYLGDFLIGATFALLLLAAAGVSRRLPGRALSRRAAGFSYSVYLCHFPLLVFALSALYQYTGEGLEDQPRLGFLALFMIALLAAYLWSYLISLATERQTPRIREWLGRMTT